MIDPKQLVGKEDMIRKIAESIPVRYRLEGLTESEQVLALPDHLLRALSDDYIASLPAEVQAQVRVRRVR